MRLHRRLERLDEHQPPADPALVTTHSPGDFGLPETVVAVERANEPRLLELRKAASLVQLIQTKLGVDDTDVDDASEQRRPAQHAGGVSALEAVEDLEPVSLNEERQRAELPVPLERAAHRRERAGVAHAQRREPLAQRRDLDLARVGLRRLHGCTPSRSRPIAEGHA